MTVNPLVTNNNKPALSGTVTDPSPSSGIASVTMVVSGQTLAATVNGGNWNVAVPTRWSTGPTTSQPRPQTERRKHGQRRYDR